MIKVKGTHSNATEFSANCRDCGYSENEIFFGQTLLDRRKSVTRCRSRARRHAETTGHVVEVEVTFLSLYKPKEGKQ
jgi:hypothetical protein